MQRRNPQQHKRAALTRRARGQRNLTIATATAMSAAVLGAGAITVVIEQQASAAAAAKAAAKAAAAAAAQAAQQQAAQNAWAQQNGYPSYGGGGYSQNPYGSSSSSGSNPYTPPVYSSGS